MEIICINCPLGCLMTVVKKEGEIVVSGNTCERGKVYAIRECTQPTRMVTTSLYVKEGKIPVISVKTSQPFPKERIFELLCALKNVSITAPVEIGDTIVKNILNTGIDIIATRKCEKK